MDNSYEHTPARSMGSTSYNSSPHYVDELEHDAFGRMLKAEGRAPLGISWRNQAGHESTTAAKPSGPDDNLTDSFQVPELLHIPFNEDTDTARNTTSLPAGGTSARSTPSPEKQLETMKTFSERLSGKIQVQAKELQRLADEVREARADSENWKDYANLCEKRLLQVHPDHPLPVTREHLMGGSPLNSSRITHSPSMLHSSSVTEKKGHNNLRAPDPSLLVSVNAQHRREQNELSAAYSKLEKNFFSANAKASELSKELKELRKSSEQKEKELQFCRKKCEKLQAENERLDAESKGTEKYVTKMESKLHSVPSAEREIMLRKKIASCEKENDRIEQEKEHLQQTLREETKANEEQRSYISVLKNALDLKASESGLGPGQSGVYVELADMRRQVDMLTEQLEEKIYTLDVANEESEMHAQAVKNLQGQLSLERQVRAKLEDTSKRFESQAQSAQDGAEKLQSEKSALMDYAQSAVDETEATKADNKTLKSANQELEEVKVALEKERMDLQERLVRKGEEIERLTMQLEERSSMLYEEQKKCEEAEALVSQKESEAQESAAIQNELLNAIRDGKKEKEELEIELVTLRNLSDDLQRRLDITIQSQSENEVELHSRLNEYERTLKEKEDYMQNLTKTLSQMEGQVESLTEYETGYMDNKKQIGELEAQLSSLRTHSESLEAAANDYKSELQLFQTRNDELHRNSEDLINQCSQLRTMVDAKSDEISQLTRKLEISLSEGENLSSQLSVAEKRCNDIETSSKNQIESLQSQLKSLNDAAARLTGEKGHLMTSIEDKDRQLSLLKDEATNESALLMEEISLTQLRLRDAENQLESSERDVKALTNEVNELRIVREENQKSLQTKESEVSTLRAELTSLDEELAKAKLENNSVTQELAELKDMTEHASAQNAESTRVLLEKVQALNGQKEETERELADLQSKCSSLSVAKEALQNSIKEMSDQMGEVTVENGSLKEQLESEKEDKRLLEAKSKKATERMKDMEAKLEEMDGDLKDKTRDVERSMSLLGGKRAEGAGSSESLYDLVSALRREAKEARLASETSKSDLTECQNELQECQAWGKKLNKETKSLRQQLDKFEDTEERNQLLIKDFEKVRESRQQWESKAKSALNQVSQLKTEIEQVSEQLATAKGELSVEREEKNESRSKVEELTERLATFTALQSDLQRMHDSFKEDAAAARHELLEYSEKNSELKALVAEKEREVENVKKEAKDQTGAHRGELETVKAQLDDVMMQLSATMDNYEKAQMEITAREKETEVLQQVVAQLQSKGGSGGGEEETLRRTESLVEMLTKDIETVRAEASQMNLRNLDLQREVHNLKQELWGRQHKSDRDGGGNSDDTSRGHKSPASFAASPVTRFSPHPERSHSHVNNGSAVSGVEVIELEKQLLHRSHQVDDLLTENSTLKAAKDYYEKQAEDLQSQVAQLSQLRNDLRVMHDSIKNEASIDRKEMVELMAKNADLVNENSSTSQQLAAKTMEHSLLEARVHEMQTERDNLSREAVTLKSSLAEREMDVENLKRKAEEITSKCDDLAESNDTLRREVLSLSSQLSEATRSREDAVRDARMLSGSVDSMERERSMLKDERDRLQKQLHHSESNTISLEREVSLLKQSVEEERHRRRDHRDSDDLVETLRTEVHDLQARLLEQQSLRIETERMYDNILDENKVLKSRAASTSPQTRTFIDRLESANADLTETNKELREHLSMCRGKISELEKQVASDAAGAAALAGTSDLGGTRSGINSPHPSLGDAKEILQVKEREIQSLTESLQLSEVGRDVAKKELARTNNRWSEEVDRLQREIQRSKEELQAERDANSRLHSQREAELNHLKEEILNLRQDNDRLSMTSRQFEDDLRRRQQVHADEIHRLEMVISQLKDDLAQAEINNKETIYLARIKQLEEHIDNLRKGSSEASSHQTRSLRLLEAENKELKSELERSKLSQSIRSVGGGGEGSEAGEILHLKRSVLELTNSNREILKENIRLRALQDDGDTMSPVSYLSGVSSRTDGMTIRTHRDDSQMSRDGTSFVPVPSLALPPLSHQQDSPDKSASPLRQSSSKSTPSKLGSASLQEKLKKVNAAFAHIRNNIALEG